MKKNEFFILGSEIALTSVIMSEFQSQLRKVIDQEKAKQKLEQLHIPGSPAPFLDVAAFVPFIGDSIRATGVLCFDCEAVVVSAGSPLCVRCIR